MSDTKLRSVRIPLELDARLVAEAERLDRSVSWLIVRALDGTVGGATQKVVTQRAKAAEAPRDPHPYRCPVAGCDAAWSSPGFKCKTHDQELVAA